MKNHSSWQNYKLEGFFVLSIEVLAAINDVDLEANYLQDLCMKEDVCQSPELLRQTPGNNLDERYNDYSSFSNTSCFI